MKNLFLSALILLITFPAVAQKTVSGVTFPEKVKVGESTVLLNGAGIREKMWIDLYACGLYVSSVTKNAQDIIDSDKHSGIKIHIVSSMITSKKMSDAVEEGFEKSTGGDMAALRDRIDKFKAIFSKEEIKKDDVYDIMYVPEKGVIVFKNGKIQPVIKGLDFKKALFGIWLGEEPADDNLKKDLLGK
ncbi:MAG: chalcone isomerase family protein [Flavobacteriales bacterium]|nr:chalcone isomerase family protein [Flavobacteriales bacterium]